MPDVFDFTCLVLDLASVVLNKRKKNSTDLIIHSETTTNAMNLQEV